MQEEKCPQRFLPAILNWISKSHVARAHMRHGSMGVQTEGSFGLGDCHLPLWDTPNAVSIN